MKKFTFIDGLPQLPDLTSDESTGQRFYTHPVTKKKLPSVTTVLGYFKKHSLDSWRKRIGDEEADKIMRRAGVRGTKFHAMMEKYLKSDQTLFEGVMPDMRQAFNDAKPVMDRIDNIHYIEAAFFSEKLGVAGRTDVIGEFDGVPSIIDFKTSLKIKKEEWIDNYFQQATAYAHMYEEVVGTPINQVVIIISVDGEDQPQVFIEKPANHIDNLLEKIEIFKRENSNVS